MSWYLTTDQINRLQIELTNYCNADCYLCDRHETNKKLLNNSFISFDKIKSIISNDNWNSLDQIHFCGNYDEPTIHPDLVDICNWLLNNTSNKVEIVIATNGGVRDSSFWKDLGFLSKKFSQPLDRLKVVWGIDGLEDTNHIYRKNVNWHHLENNFRTYIDNGGYAVWQFIGFDHNVHQFNTIQKKYKDLGFKKLKVINTFRKTLNTETAKKNISVADKKNNPVDLSTVLKNKNHISSLKEESEYLENIKCKAIDINSALEKSLYINHQGLVTPCCWMGTLYKLEKIKSIYKNYDSKMHDINYFDRLSDMLQSSFFKYLRKSIEEKTNPICKYHCTVKGKKSSKEIYISN